MAEWVSPKMMPGQEPYTESEYRQLQAMLAAAMDAEEWFTLDDLERHDRLQDARRQWEREQEEGTV